MNVDTLFFFCGLAASVPFLAVAVILAHYFVRRALWQRRKRLGREHLGFCPSSSSLGMAFQFMQIFHRPSMAYVVEAKQVEDAEDDDDGGPESPAKHLTRQLRRIRRGEHVETLKLRLFR